MRDNNSKSIVMHELLHARSVSYFSPETYKPVAGFEESAVEYLHKQICKMENLEYDGGYLNHIKILEQMFKYSPYDNEMQFAIDYFETPMTRSEQWLFDKIMPNLNIEQAIIFSEDLESLGEGSLKNWKQRKY